MLGKSSIQDGRFRVRGLGKIKISPRDRPLVCFLQACPNYFNRTTRLVISSLTPLWALEDFIHRASDDEFPAETRSIYSDELPLASWSRKVLHALGTDAY